MNNTIKTTPGVNRPRRGRRLALSERLAIMRSYPSFGSSALTGVLR